MHCIAIDVDCLHQCRNRHLPGGRVRGHLFHIEAAAAGAVDDDREIIAVGISQDQLRGHTQLLVITPIGDQIGNDGAGRIQLGCCGVWWLAGGGEHHARRLLVI